MRELALIALGIGLVTVMTPLAQAIEGNADAQFNVNTGDAAYQTSGAAGGACNQVMQFDGSVASFNKVDLSGIGVTVALNPGAPYTFNASGTSSVDTTTCPLNSSWFPQYDTGTGVDSSGNFAFVTTVQGQTTNYSVPHACGGDCGCLALYSNVYTTAQSSPSFPNSATSGNTINLTASTSGTNYVYLQMEEQCVTGNNRSTNVYECQWTGVSSGTWSCATTTMCL